MGNEFWSKGISSQTFFTSESGKTLGILILTGCCYGTLSEQKHVVKNLYSKGIFKPDRFFFFLTAGTYGLVELKIELQSRSGVSGAPLQKAVLKF